MRHFLELVALDIAHAVTLDHQHGFLVHLFLYFYVYFRDPEGIIIIIIFFLPFLESFVRSKYGTWQNISD